MRFKKAETILSLALEMQASRMGVSLQDISEKFDVTHRTAQRMRDAILRIFPHVEEITEEDSGVKRWRIE